MDTNRIDALMTYILATAGESEEYRERELGRLHIIKYIYLADLWYAEKHAGQTWTGIDWEFYRFGPWSTALDTHMQGALDATGAERRSYPSAYSEEDYDRWCLRDGEARDRAERAIGIEITGMVTSLVRQYANYTGDLLDFVYRTPPMLRAAPRERLDFTPSGWTFKGGTPFTAKEKSVSLTAKQEKKMKAWEATMRDKIAAKLASMRASKASSVSSPEPRYDEVFFTAIEAMDGSELPALPSTQVTAKFSPDVWKSKARHDPDLSE
jgi:hypothetical protein